MEAFFANLIKQRLLICLGFFFAVIGGIYAFQNLPIDAFPDLTNNQVQILTDTKGMDTINTEQLVTIPIEAMMNGLPKVRQIRSQTKFGLSVISIVFEDSVNLYLARQLVNERLQSAKARLPIGIDPEMGPITTAMGEIYQYVVEGKGYSVMDLKTMHDWDIRYQLRSVPGVNEVNTWGGLTQEYEVVVQPEKLRQYRLTLEDVFSALENNNQDFSGGIIEHASEQYIVHGLGRVQKIEDIGNIIVKSEADAPIYLKNIAQVQYGNVLRQGAVTKDGKGEVVTGLVMMLKGENSRAVIERVKAKILNIRKTLPEGVYIKPFYDQTYLVEQTLHTIQSNLLEGGMLVILVLLFMLGNIRAALIVATAIPLSLMFSFMGMKALGISANIMSLGAIDFGMIVDGSIVVVENTMRRLSNASGQHLNRFEIIQNSLREMAKPVLFGILIITVVYMPVLALEGMEYKMFSPMVFTICFALLGSLLISLTLIPVLCSFFLKKGLPEKESLLIRKIKRPYHRLLHRALNHPRAIVAVSVFIFLATVASVPFLGSEFLPRFDEGDYIIETRNLPSMSLSEATKLTTRIEKVLKKIPEVKTVVSKTGRPDLATDPMSVYETDVYVIIKPRDQWRFGLSKPQLTDALRQTLTRNIIGAHFNFTQPIEMRVNELVSGVRADVAIKVFGDNMAQLAQIAHHIKKVLADVPGQTDLQVEKLSGSNQLQITPDRRKMALYGVNISAIRTLIETAIMGKPVTEVLDGRKRFAIRVKFPEGSKIDPEMVQDLLVETTLGQQIPLSQVAKVEIGQGIEVINREAGARRIVVQCNIYGRDVGTFVQQAKAKITRAITLPPGYFIEWGGQFENQQRAMHKLILIVPLSILIIFCLLMASFGSVKNALLVLINIPFALIGGILALWLRGMYLSVPATVGFVALFGVAVLNGLVLVSTINKLRLDGANLYGAIIQAAESRLRPVLMTALVAMLGFMPMALSQGAGAEIQKPLATVVIGGLITSTLLTLLVLPVIYSWANGRKSLRTECSTF